MKIWTPGKGQPTTPPSLLPLIVPSQVEFRVWNSLANLELDLVVHTLEPDGDLMPAITPADPTSDRALNTYTQDVGLGYLISVQVRVTTGTPLHGQCFVQALLIRGRGASRTVLSTLFADYVTAMSFPAYPGSPIRAPEEGPGFTQSLAGTNPAAGVEITETVPTNALWRLNSIRFVLVTDATVTNRTVSLHLDDGATSFFSIEAPSVQAASLTYAYTFAIQGAIQDRVVTDFTSVIPPLLLPQTFRIRTSITNLQAGDDIGAPEMHLSEWLQE